MSGFSDYLDFYMDENSVTSAELSKETSIDRTTVFRYRKGTRVPTDEQTVARLADGLRMSVPEKEKLFEEYDRLTIGELTVNSFLYIKKLLKDLKDVKQTTLTMSTHADHSLREYCQNPVMEIRSQNDILTYLSALFDFAKEADEAVSLVMQPIYESVHRLILSSFRGSEVQIEQIICLEQSLSRSYQNLETFQTILPLCFELLNYHVQYYYDFLSHHINPMSWMPNIVIVGDYVLQFNHEMDRGVLLHDGQYAEIMKSEYHKMKSNSSHFLASDTDQMFVMDAYNKLKSETAASLFVEPCLGMGISSDIYEQYLYPFPKKELFIREMVQKNGDWEDMDYVLPDTQQNFKSFCKKESIRTFMETGRIHEFPDGFYETLPMDVRKTVLKRVIRLVREGRLSYYFLPEEFLLPEQIYFYWIFEQKKVCINQVMGHGVSQIVVQEPGICRAFQSFYEYMEQKNMLTSKEEVLRVLEEVRDEYR